MKENIIKLILGDCLEKMKDLPDNSVDAIVTDPPYELGFMGKSWDKTGIANNVEVWRECLRVLKPGGHLLSFGGTRTYHRMASAIEDAGFEVRDMIEWVYGSGFPKSLNIAKMIDKRGGKSVSWFGKWLRGWRERENILQKEISKLFPSKTGGLTGCVANWELGLNMPTNEQFNLICKTFNLPFESLEEAERQVIGTTITNKTVYQNIGGKNESGEIEITKGTSEWEGWGSALKPAHEPICFARKPLEKGLTIAENCLKWGTGGINIDESRVGTTGGETHKGGFQKQYVGDKVDYENHGVETDLTPIGRFPANLIHDNSEEVRECFPENVKGEIGRAGRKSGGNYEASSYKVGVVTETGFKDNGNASRFFKSIIYQSKASKKDRGEGNTHATVKPTKLMEYLINMVSRDGATILDPFMGSGTTGVACKNLNRNFIGIELDPTYFEIAKNRINERNQD